MAEGININEEDVQKQNVPDDLNSLAVGSYVIPDPIGRRRFGHLVSVIAFINLLLNYLIDWINFATTSFILFLVAIFIYLIDNRISLNQNSIIESTLGFIPINIQNLIKGEANFSDCSFKYFSSI